MSDVPPESPSGTGWRPPSGGYQPPGSPPPPPGGSGQPPQYPPPPPPGGYQPQYGHQAQYGPPQGQQPVGPGGRPLAEWWKRLVALIIDTVILLVPAGILFGIWVVALRESEEVVVDPLTDEIISGEGTFAGSFFAVFAVVALLNFLYYWLLNGGARGQTLGKRVLGIQVRDANTGGPLGLGKGFLRQFMVGLFGSVPFVQFVLLPLDYLWPLWDQRRQALHDKVAGSVVVDAP